MQCRKAPWMEPYILYATLPPGPPPPSWDLNYEADGLPETATPAMTGSHSDNMQVTASGGLLNMDVPPTPDLVESSAVYQWILPTFTTLELEVSWPTLYAPTPEGSYIYVHVFTSAGAGLDFACVREHSYEGGWSERNYVYNNNDFYWEGPLKQAFSVILVQDPGPGQYDIYLDGALIGSNVSASMDLLGFSALPYSTSGVNISLDYLRAKITI